MFNKTKGFFLASFLIVFFLGLFLYSFYSNSAGANEGKLLAQSSGRLCGQTCGAGYGACASYLQCKIRPGSTTTGVCINPAGPQCGITNYCCALLTTVPGTNIVVSPSGSNTAVTPIPPNPTGATDTNPTVISPQYQCIPDCDGNSDGVINQQDIDEFRNKLRQNPNDPTIMNLHIYCKENCFREVLLTGTVTGVPSSLNGDCASPAGPGQKDGKVDMYDFNQLKTEFEGYDSTTTFCDFNGDNIVTIQDFGVLREGYITSQ